MAKTENDSGESAFKTADISTIDLRRAQGDGDWPDTIVAKAVIIVTSRIDPHEVPSQVTIGFRIDDPTNGAEPLRDAEQRARSALRSTLRFLAETI